MAERSGAKSAESNQEVEDDFRLTVLVTQLNSLATLDFRLQRNMELGHALCVAWLGNVAMIQPLPDFGIFNFLLVNACLGFAVNVFNLGVKAWLVYAACLGFAVNVFNLGVKAWLVYAACLLLYFFQWK
ncbi:hypothetical protein MTR67_006238 [Solanum verrucosum]|uniref:Uncharacterized protein n=1 Tax=Solanum verrucosum TaxID=315347 RepID=A0AAF0PXG4_SOLVR|nr:hypothetical protein MTR67_006238 [Solanum verrucosum]